MTLGFVRITRIEQTIKQSDIEQKRQLLIIDIEGKTRRTDNSTELTNK